ncbi:hypothetical protein EDB81DRAFT_891518 [Dactylonectria macrodidyma]|uniref:Uncharacterized protein n=1 Tax=Dactylonectria macrodidyma TaxID=307937 RepID=A0A9P9DK20_9HYPO|nr:hypothetical protein EDB81DRAFT_891518 [Dactylonectria macrodidyma]
MASDFEHDCRKAAFGSNTTMNLSTQSFTGSNDFEFATLPSDIDATTLFPSQSPSIPNFPAWAMSKPQTYDLTMQFQLVPRDHPAPSCSNMVQFNKTVLRSQE